VFRRLSTRQMIGIVTIAGIALTATILWAGANTAGPSPANWWLALSRVIYSYALGIVLGRHWAARRSAVQGMDAPPDGIAVAVALAAPVLVLVILAGLPINGAAGDIAAVLVILPALFWRAATTPVPEWLRRPLEGLGKLSFPLYAVHMPIIGYWARNAPGRDGGNSYLAMATAILAAVALNELLAAFCRRKSGPLIARTA